MLQWHFARKLRIFGWVVDGGGEFALGQSVVVVVPVVGVVSIQIWFFCLSTSKAISLESSCP